MTEKKYLRADEAAIYAGCCIETLRRAARGGELGAMMIGRTFRFTRDALDAWIERGGRTGYTGIRLKAIDDDTDATAHETDADTEGA
jgi:excisionase family DNA binding protein